MARSRGLGLAEGALVVVLFLAALATFSRLASSRRADGDESLHLSFSRAYVYVFERGELGGPAWTDGDWALAHPKLAFYLIGGWLTYRGHDVLSLLPLEHFDYQQTVDWNRRHGLVPDRAVLQDARAPIVLSGALVVPLAYLLARRFSGPPGGLVAGLVLLTSPLLQSQFTLAILEAPATLLILVALLLGVVGLGRGDRGELPARWIMPFGGALGLALATKFTALPSLVAVVGWVVVTLTARGLAGRGPDRPATDALRLAAGWLAGLAVAVAVLVASDPFLWLNPVERLGQMARYRTEIMALQQGEFPATAVLDPWARPGLVARGALQSGTALGARGWPVEAVLAVVGVIWLVRQAWSEWRQRGRPGGAVFVLLTCGAHFSVVALGLGLDWPRYYVANCVLGALLAGIGAGGLASGLSRLLGPGQRRRSLESPAPTRV